MKYRVQWIENKPTKSGIARSVATLTDEQNQEIAEVSLWASSWPNLATIMPGAEVEGTLVEKQNGQYLNRTLNPIKVASLGPRPAWAQKKDIGASVAQAQEVRREDVKTAQERTQEGVKRAGSIRDAVQLTVARIPAMNNPSDEDIQEEIKKWEKWLLGLHEEPFV